MSTAPTTPTRRSTRRPIPPLIFLLVLALLALGVWWKVLQTDVGTSVAATPSCVPAGVAAEALDPATVAVRVLNATDRTGLAELVGTAVTGRGFTLSGVGNDDGGHPVVGVGEVRYGPAGTEAARLVAANLAGAVLVPDTRGDTGVDLVVGPDYADLTAPDQVAAVLAATPAAPLPAGVSVTVC